VAGEQVDELTRAHALYNLGLSQAHLHDDYDDVVESLRGAAQLYIQLGDLHGGLLATANLGALAAAHADFQNGATLLPALVADILERQAATATLAWSAADGSLLAHCYAIVGSCCHALGRLAVGSLLAVKRWCIF
jgi:hypothetical protein